MPLHPCHNDRVLTLPVLALSDWGLTIGIVFVLFLFLVVGYVVIQGTRVQLAWRERVEQGDVEAIQALVSEEINRWKTVRMPKGMQPSVWRGVQSAELVEVKPEGVRLSAAAEGQYAMVDGERRETSNLLSEGMRLSAQLIDMVLYDIPNVRLPYVQVDIYSTFRDEQGSAQRCILSTLADRETAGSIDWEFADAEEVIRAFRGQYALDDRGNPLPLDPDAPKRNGIPAVFYEDE